METWRCTRLLIWLLSSILAACAGGSGSSGFDIRPENSAIQQALSERRCVQHESLDICPAGQSPLSPGTQPTPGPTTPPSATPQVVIGIDPGTPLICMPLDQNGACGFALFFEAQGFPATATFRVGARWVNPDGHWTIAAALTSADSADRSVFHAPVTLSAPTNATHGPSAAQAAVLVFLNPSTGAPNTVEELTDTGADAAYITDPFTVEQAASPP